MKNLLLIFSLLIVAAQSFGQWSSFYELNFDDSYGIEHLKIDTVSNPSNSWQIGSPQKTLFTSAFSIPNVIVTDTVNSYPINDTSSFQIHNVADLGFVWPHTVVLEGNYFVNSDSLTDYGTIEFSPDNGNTWVDLINDPTYDAYLMWYYPKPVLTGNSNGWKHFYVNLSYLGPLFNVQFGDTVAYRFTFISDSVQTNKDGLMFDSFHFEDYVEGIDEIQNSNLISLYPNPTSEQLLIKQKSNSTSQAIQIFDFKGQMVYENLNFIGQSINIQHFENGVYVVKYSNENTYCVKQFIVEH